MHRHPRLGSETRRSYPARAWVSAAVYLLVWMFPALMAGVSLDASVRSAEVAHLRSVNEVSPSPGVDNPAQYFFRAILPAGVAGIDAEQLVDMVPQARLGSLVAILLISGLLMVSVSLVRGRITAVLACLAFGCLPPVVAEGVLIRPELPSTVFAMLGLMFLVGMPGQLGRLRHLSAWLHGLALALVVGLGYALACASLPSYGIYLLVPGAAMAIAVASNLGRCVRVWRRRGLVRWPALALAGRIGPWVVAAFVALLFAALLVPEAGSAESATGSSLALLPEHPLLRGLVLVLAFAGVGSQILRLVLERTRRLGSEVILFAYVVILLLHRMHISPTAIDSLPAAPALAILLAEGARLVLAYIFLRSADSHPYAAKAGA